MAGRTSKGRGGAPLSLPLLLGVWLCGASTLLPALVQGPAEDSFEGLLHRGFEFHQRADYAHSLPLLQRAWKLDPGDYFANLLLGIDLLRTGKAEPALKYLAEASRQRPTEDFPYAYSGEANALLGNYAEAAAAYLKATTISRDSTETVEGWVDFSLERFRQLAGVLRSSQRGLAAEYRLQARSYALTNAKRRPLLAQSASLDGAAPGIWSELAFADFAVGDLSGARSHLDRALAASLSDLRAMEVEALLAAAAGEWQTASRELNEIGGRSAGSLSLMLREWPAALRPAEATNLSGAAAKFFECVSAATAECAGLASVGAAAKSVATAPAGKLFQEARWDRLVQLREPLHGDAPGWLRRGIAYAALERCDDAIPALERGLAARSQREYARFLLSQCYADVAGRAEAAIQRLGGDQALSHMVRGDVLLRMQGETAGAITEYQAAVAIRGRDPKLLERLAEAELAAGDFSAAEANARAALALDAHRYSARQTIARVAMEQGKYEEALPLLRELTAEKPQDAGTQISLATALSQTGDSAGALRALQPLLAAGYPDEKGNLHSLLGALLKKTGHPAEAAAAYATARELSEAYQQHPHREAGEPQ